MINILTKFNGDTSGIIMNFNPFFNLYVLVRDFGDLDRYAMKKIDHAELIDGSNDIVKTPYGVTSIFNMSTGCKVVLSYLHITRNREDFNGKALNVTGCGANALEVLFECMDSLEDSDTVLFLGHSNMLTRCKDRDYNINGFYCRNLRKGVACYG